MLAGSGAWRTVLESTGFGRRIEAFYFDIPDFSIKFACLLEALGTSYEKCLLELTNLPFWLAFDTIDLDRPIPGTENIPIVGWNSPIIQVSQIGKYRAGGEASIYRFCPMCLEADLRLCGEPYWHRVHQLPNVVLCPLHLCVLRTCCQSCGRAFAAAMKSLPAAAALFCVCGHDLRKDVVKPIISSTYLRLLRVSCDALASGLPQWDRDSVRLYLRDKLKNSGTSYRSLLGTAFQVTNSAARTMFTSIAADNSAVLHFHRDITIAAAPDCCALLAALDISFAVAKEGFSGTMPSCPAVPNLLVCQGDSLDDAKRYLLDQFKKRGKLEGGRRPYWKVRFRDPDWLYQYFERSPPQVPSRTQDRASINLILHNGRISIAERRAKIRVMAAGIRAQIRDGDWFRSRLSALDLKKRQSLDVQKKRRLRERVRVIERAIETLIAEEAKPRRIDAVVVAGLVGLSHSQVAAAIRSSPSLQKSIARANETKVRRQLMLAARQCLNEGIPLAHSRIARSAGLPTTRENIALIEEILDELYATGVPRYEWKLPYDPDDVRPLREKGMTLEEIAKELGMSTSSVHRFLKRAS